MTLTCVYLYKQWSNALEVQVTYKLYSDLILLSILLPQNKANENFSCAGLQRCFKITQCLTTTKANPGFFWHHESGTFSQHLTHLFV